MSRALSASLLAAVLIATSWADPQTGDGNIKPLKIGVIGLDTSHVTAFAKIVHNPKNEGDLRGFKIVAAYPGGSPDIASSRDRVAGFTKQMKEIYGVEIVNTIDDLLPKVDVVLLESVDGRVHLEQAKAVILAGKPLFIDKPMAASLVDVLKIFAQANKHKVPCFSSSSLRFNIAAMKNDPGLGGVVGATVYAPCSLEEHHPDLMWYGVHGIEMLYTVMGTGCETVTRTHTQGTDVATGIWKEGKIGIFRGIRDGKADYGATLFGSKKVATLGGVSTNYEPLVVAICKFFRTGHTPVSAEETIEMFTFMEAADESKRQGGAPVSMASVLAKAKALATSE
jgi:Oxidoreductase family, NAD-binding Rossmann fold